MAYLITPEKLLVIIDEVSVSYYTRKDRSWLMRGKNNEINIISLKGSQLIIMTVTTQKFIAYPLVKSNNSKTFFRFIE